MKLLALLPVLAVIFVSGCVTTGGTAVATGPGVVIQGWEPDFTQVFSEEPVTLQLKVQNQGQARAKNVVAELAGIDVSEWGSFGGFASQQNLGDLIAADSTTGTPGETRTVTFRNLLAPRLAKGTEFAYTPIVKVSYDYITTAHKPITLVDQTELRRIQQQGQTLPTQATTQSAGPLNVEIRTGNFVKTSGSFDISGGRTYEIFPVYIQVTNALWEQGGSVVPKDYFGGSAYGGFNQENYPVIVRITPPSGTQFVYSGYSQQDCSSNLLTVDLWQGKSAEITCELQVTSPPQFQQQSLITVEADYRFFSEARTSIKVVGTSESGAFGY